MSDFRIQGVIDADARRFQTTIAGVLKSFGSLQRAHAQTAATSKVLERQTRDLNKALEHQNAQVATLILNYRALRNVVLGLALTTAIAGFRGLTASIGALGAGIIELTTSAAKLGAGLGVLGAAGLAAVAQGAVVATLGFKDMAKAFTTAGTEHEKAMAKLTAPAREFVGQLRDMQMAFREIKLLAQQGLFEGVVAGVKAAQPVLEPLKQVVFDTAQAMGYLADRVGVLVGQRANDLKAFGERNVVTLRRMGDAAINLGDAFLQVFRAADPFIGHVTAGIVTLSKTLDEAAIKARKDGSLGSFFFEIRKEWDTWTSTFGHVGAGLLHIFQAANDPAKSVAAAIHDAAESFDRWTGSTTGQARMRSFFEESNRVLGSMARFAGDLMKDLGGLAVGGGDSAITFFDTMRQHVLPVLRDLAVEFDKGLFQNLMSLAAAVSDFIRAALPGMRPVADAMGQLVGAITGLLKVTTPLIQSLPGVTKLVAAFAIGGGVLGAWSKFTDLLGLAFLRARMLVGLAPEMTGFGAVAGQILTRGGRINGPQAGLVQTVGRGGGGGFAGGFGPGAVSAGFPRGRQSQLPYLQPGRVTFDAKTANALEREMKDLEALAGVMSIGPHGARDKNTGAFIPNSRYGATGERTAAYRDFQNLDLTGRSTALKLRENVGGAINAGVTKGMQLAKPVITAGFAIGATNGVITALSSDSHGLQAKLRDFFSGATFGAIKTDQQRLTGNAQKLAAGIAQGQFNPNVGGAKTRGSVKLNLVSPQDRESAKDFLDLLKAMGKISDDSKQKLVAMIDAFGARVDKVGPQAAKLKGAIAEGLDLGGVSAKVETEVDRIKGSFAALAADGGKSLSRIKADVKANAQIIQGELGKRSESGRLALAKNFRLAAAAVQQSMDAGAISTKRGTALIEHYLENALMQFGLTRKQARNYQSNPTGDISGKGAVGQPGSGQGAATGALTTLPGQPGRDSIPLNVGGKKIVAAPGEDVAVINRHQRKVLDERTRDLGGFAGVFRNIRTPHSQNEVRAFAEGGIAQQGTGNAFSRLLGAANRIDSRHMPYRWGGGHDASFGGPYDCSGAWSAILHAAGLLSTPEVSGQFMNYGLPGPGTVTLYANPSHVYGTIRGRAWGTSGQNPGGGAGWFDGGARPGFAVRHVPEQLLGKIADAAGGLGGSIKRALAVPGLGAVTGLSQSALDTDRAAAQHVLDQAGAALGVDGGGFGGGDLPEGGAPSKNMEIGRSMAASLYHWVGAQWTALRNLGNRESGWSTTARNPSSGAFGIGQFLGATKAAYAKFGATASTAGEQINAMLHYIHDRYGSPVAAWAHEQANGWYERGGLIETLFASAGQPPIPGRNGGTPSPDPGGAVPPASQGDRDARGHKKKPPHKKPPKPYAKHHPVPDTSKIKGDKVKAKDRKKSKRKLFYPKLHGGSEVAEALLAKRLPNYDQLYESPISTFQNLLTNLAGQADLTDEEAVVTLFDSGSFGDLSAFWAANPTLAKTYQGNIDSLDVVNVAGAMVQGKWTPGINQHVAELMGQVHVHTGGDTSARGGLIGTMDHYIQALAAQGIPAATKLRAQAVSELKRLKEHWAMWQGRRQHDNKKIAQLSKGGVSWQQRVADNKARVDALQDYKRRVRADAVGHRLTEQDQKNLHKADQEIADLNQDSEHLRNTKPAAKHEHESKKDRAHRLRLLSHLRSDRDEALLRMDELDGSRDKWTVEGGLAKDWTDRVATYTQSITDQQAKLVELQQVRLPAESLELAQLAKEISDWRGTAVPLPKVEAQGPDQEEINALLKQQNEDLAKQLAVSRAEAGVFTDFAPLLAKNLVGVFEHGGVVPRTGLALVHQNETIIPDPQGPFGNAAAAAMRGGNTSMAVHFHGELAGLVKLVDARINQVAPKLVDKKLGRDGRSLHFAPGG